VYMKASRHLEDVGYARSFQM